MRRYFPLTALCLLLFVAPVFADEYDMSSFNPNRRSAGESSFRITPDMYPKHSYRRKELMQTYGPQGKSVGYTQIQGKAFDYMNGESLNDRRNKAKGTDIYLDNAYQAPLLDRKYDPAYHQNLPPDQMNELKPLGDEQSTIKSQFKTIKQGAGQFFSSTSSNQTYINNNYDKFNKNQANQMNPQNSQNYKVFDDESMF